MSVKQSEKARQAYNALKVKRNALIQEVAVLQKEKERLEGEVASLRATIEDLQKNEETEMRGKELLWLTAGGL